MSKGITGISSVTLGVRSLKRSLDFYCGVWGLALVERDGERAYLRAAGPEPVVLVITEQPNPGLLNARLRCATARQLELLRAELPGAGANGMTPIAAEAMPGGGEGFSFSDPEGRRVSLYYAERPEHAVMAAADRRGQASPRHTGRLASAQQSRRLELCRSAQRDPD